MDFRHTTDVEYLRQVATMQDREIERLLGMVAKQQGEIAELRGQTSEALQAELAILFEQVKRARKERFGTSSERRGRTRRPSAQERAATTASAGPGDEAEQENVQPGQPELLRVEDHVTLPDAALDCPCCGGALHPMTGGTEASEVVHVVQRTYEIHQVLRQKYVCACREQVVTAPIPPALAPIVPGGRFSIDFAIEVAIDKYERHLPLERQRVAMERAGLVVSTQTLFEQLWHLCGALSTTYSALPDLIHTADWLHIDETRWPLLDGKTPRLQQVWAMNSTNAAYYRILPSRGADAALELLRGFKGVVVCDAAGAYASAARREGIRLAACWVHGRRPLVQVESDYPEATEVLDWIDELFLIEREVPLEPANTMLQRRAAARAERSRPLVDKILAWAEANHTRIPTDIGVQPGARYLYGLRELLRVFLDHPYVPLSNNPAEQRCRRPVLGRKNHYGSKSKRGTLVAATLYSLIETAHMNGIHPAAYLRAIVEHNRDHPDAPLLPADFLARTRAQASA